MRTSFPLVYSSLYSTFWNVCPPSVERKIPRSALGPYGWPSAATNSRFGSRGSTSIIAIICVSRRPRCVHVLPASVDLYTPSPVARSGRMMPAPDADVDDVRVRRRDGDRADRARRLVVEERHPRRPVVGRAPHAAVVEAGVEHVRLAGTPDRARARPARTGRSGASAARGSCLVAERGRATVRTPRRSTRARRGSAGATSSGRLSGRVGWLTYPPSNGPASMQ